MALMYLELLAHSISLKNIFTKCTDNCVCSSPNLKVTYLDLFIKNKLLIDKINKTSKATEKLKKKKKPNNYHKSTI